MKIRLFVPWEIEIPDAELAKIHRGVLLQRKLRKLPVGDRVFTHEIVVFANTMGQIDRLSDWLMDSDQDFPWSEAELLDAAEAARQGISLTAFVRGLEQQSRWGQNGGGS